MVRACLRRVGSAAVLAVLVVGAPAHALPKDGDPPGDTGLYDTGTSPEPDPPKVDPGPDRMSDPNVEFGAQLDGLLDGGEDTWPGFGGKRPPDNQIWPGTTNVTMPKAEPYELGGVFTTMPDYIGRKWVETWALQDPVTYDALLGHRIELDRPSTLADSPVLSAFTADPAYRYLKFEFSYYGPPSALAVSQTPPNPVGSRAAEFDVRNSQGASIGALYRVQVGIAATPTITDVWVLFPGFVVGALSHIDLVPVPLANPSLKDFLVEQQVAFTPDTRFVKTAATLSTTP